MGAVPLLGVVWEPPDAPGPALQQLTRIHATGATAVRLTALPASDTLFARADSLGLRLFVDLPVAHVSAAALGDALVDARPALDRLRTLARRHASVQYVGLAHHANTTTPAACPVLAEWTDRLHSAPVALRTYYVTPFSASVDRCAGAVDLPLLDTRGGPDPVERWKSWAGDTTQVGVGALGTWVRSDSAHGLQVPHSPERQARYLERVFSRVLDAGASAPAALFVYRWADRADPLSFRHYGLHEASGAPRPAADVVTGFYTGEQRVFAFPSGTAPASAPHGHILIGWILIAVLAVLYAQSPYVQQTAARYFSAHGFYRDAVRKGRDVGPAINALLLLVATIAFGSIVSLLLRSAGTLPSAEHVVAALPPSLRALVVGGLAQPILAGTLVSGGSLVLLLGWMLILVLVARQETSFSFAQGLMLVAWPCWPALVGLIVALVIATAPLGSSFVLGLLIGGGTIIAITTRVLRDYQSVTRLPAARVMALALPSPLVLLLFGFTVFTLQYDLPLSFLWALLTNM